VLFSLPMDGHLLRTTGEALAHPRYIECKSVLQAASRDGVIH
jgi:hypothetical protein